MVVAVALPVGTGDAILLQISIKHLICDVQVSKGCYVFLINHILSIRNSTETFDGPESLMQLLSKNSLDLKPSK